MKHYQDGQWADYVRNLVGTAAAAEMRRHLAACRPCGARLASLERMRRTAVADRQVPLPRDAMRSVYAFFDVQQRRAGALSRLGLVSDSALAPGAAGARSGQSGARHLLYRSDDYTLEVRIERLADEPQVSLVGELVRLPHEPQAHVPVHLLVGERLEAASTTDTHGSFRFEWPQGLPLELCLWPEAEHCIGVTLDRPAAS